MGVSSNDELDRLPQKIDIKVALATDKRRMQTRKILTTGSALSDFLVRFFTRYHPTLYR